MRKILFVVLGCVTLFSAALLAGPVSSGAMLLLLPGPYQPADHDLPDDYAPVHAGGIDLSTGLYVRENEDLVVRGTPALTLRRTYLSGYRASRHFGIGATHDGERYLHGDGDRFQWAELIRADGSRVSFTRTSPGSSVMNAMYRHWATPTEWQGARLGWTGGSWALRRRDGSLDRFQPCGPGVASACSVVSSRDADGHVIYYRRDTAGRLLRMTADSRWIAFVYDSRDRIVRAHDSASQEARYDYDAAGRLSRVTAGDGTVRRYTYTDRDELATISEPEASIENVYDHAGRCTSQINRYPGGAEHVFTFDYTLKDGRVVETRITESDGSWKLFGWNQAGHAMSEAGGRDGTTLVSFGYERDARTNTLTGLTLTCPDRTGRPLRHTSVVRDNEDWIKWDLVRTHCSLSDGSWRQRASR